MEVKIERCLSCGDPLPPYVSGPRRKYCVKSQCNANSRGKVLNVTITRLQRSWTKYGGVRNNLRGERKRSSWSCQACGKDMPKQIPAYIFFFDDELLRICPDCEHKTIINQIKDFMSLVRQVRVYGS